MLIVRVIEIVTRGLCTLVTANRKRSRNEIDTRVVATELGDVPLPPKISFRLQISRQN